MGWWSPSPTCEFVFLADHIGIDDLTELGMILARTPAARSTNDTSARTANSTTWSLKALTEVISAVIAAVATVRAPDRRVSRSIHAL